MGIRYSLICFGGKDGKAVTASNSGGYLLLTATKHGVRNGLKVYFSGTLPGNIASTSTPYYLRGETIDTATVYDTQAHAIAGGTTGKVAWSSAGSSVKITSAYWYELAAGSGTTGRARYGLAGSERCYDGLKAARDARYSAAVSTDVEVIEFVTQFFDYQTTLISLNIPAAQIILTPSVDEVPTDAAHGGVIQQVTHNGASLWLPNGYICDQQTYYLYGVVELSGFRHEIEGISFSTDQTNTYGVSAPASGLYNKVKKCMLVGYGAPQTLRLGLFHRQDTLEFTNNLVYGWTGTNSMGVQVYGYDAGNGSVICNNSVFNNATGFGSANTGTSPKGWYYNNESLGNTTNWGTTGTGSMHGVGYNAGLSGEAWGATGRATIATTDFANFAGYDFSPAALTSPQVDTGVVVIGMTAEDVAGNERPNYIGATDGTTVTAGSFIVGNNYTIDTVGSTSFTSIGASANTVGVSFKATGVGSGTGTAVASGRWDIGADEFDHGYTRPEQHDLVLTVEAGYDIKVFTAGDAPGATPLDSDSSSGTTYTYPAGVAGVTVDFTVQKLGKKPVRFTNVALDATETAYTITLETDLNYVTSSGLTWSTNFTYDTTNKYLKSSAATSGRNLYSALIEAFIAQSALNNVSFDFEMNGPGGLVLKNGVETRGYSTAGNGYDWNTSTSTLYKITDDGVQYKNTSGTVTATFASITTTGIPAGVQGRFQQADGSGTTNFRSTGDMNQLVQVYGDGTHGSVSALTHFVAKVQAPGYDEAAMDAVATYGDLEGQGYIVPLLPVANGIADASGITGLTYTDHAGSPVTWNSKVFSITITDTTDTHSGEQIIQWIRHNNTFNYHDLVQKNGAAYKTVRGAIYGDTGATLKGVRVVRSDGSTGHYDFDLFTADDGTTYSPPVIAALTASAAANTRFVLYNVTQDAEIDNVFASGGGYAYTITTEADVSDTLDLHYFTQGYEEGRTRFTWGGVSTTVAVDQTADAVESSLATELGITGADVTEFAMDVTGAIEIDADDADGSTQKSRLALWYKYILTTEDGARHFRGAISLLSTAAFRINVSVLDLKIENISTTYGLNFTDTERRLYRSDGAPIYAAVSAPGSIQNDYSGVPDTVETGVSGLTGPESAAILDIAGVKAKTDSLTFNGTLLEVDMKKTNGTAIKGDGTVADKFRSTLVA